MKAWLVRLTIAVSGAVALPSAALAQSSPPPADAGAQPNSESSRPNSESSRTGDEVSRDGARRSALSKEAAEQGEAELFKAVRVFQQRYLLKAGRAELLIGGGSSFGDPLVHHWQADAGLLYHLTERWSLGANGAKHFGSTTASFDDIKSNYGLFPEKSALQAGGFGEVQFSPVFGKFSSFGITVLQIDAYLLAGGGVVRTTRGEKLKPAGVFGVGMRIHTLRWLTVSAELRDVALIENFQAGDALLQHVFAGLRLGFWLPPTVQYRYPR